MVIEVGTLITVLIFLTGSIIGAYAYVFKRTAATEDTVETALKDNSKALNDLALAVTNRLTAIEKQLEIQLPKKGGDGSHSQ